MEHLFGSIKIDALYRNKINELRQAIGEELLKETSIFDDDYSLLRWLLQFSSDKIDDIAIKFKRSSSIIRCLKFNQLEIDDIDEINEYVGNLFPGAKYFPGGILGFDKEGYLIIVQSLAKSCPKELIKCGRVSDLYRLALTECTLVNRLVRYQEKKTGQKLGIKVIVDLEGWNMGLIYMPAIRSYINLLHLLQEVFPDMAKTLYVINSPPIISTVYPIIKRAFAARTRDKIVFYSQDYKQKLIEDIGADHIYEKWGGTLKPKKGSPITGTLRMGGMPDDSLKYNPAKNPLHPSPKELTKISISARHKSEIKICIEKPSFLNWFFLTNRDIDFSITKNGQEIWPRMRISTEFVPEYGTIQCEEPGEYLLVFDNTFSIFFGKNVKYHIFIE